MPGTWEIDNQGETEGSVQHRTPDPATASACLYEPSRSQQQADLSYPWLGSPHVSSAYSNATWCLGDEWVVAYRSNLGGVTAG